MWQHCKEAGIDGDIATIAKHFDIAEINVYTPGKLTYINDRMRKMVRINVATESGVKLKDLIAKSKGGRR